MHTSKNWRRYSAATRSGSVTVLLMEMPCCSGTTMIIQKACEVAGVRHDIKVQTVGIDGEVKR